MAEFSFDHLAEIVPERINSWVLDEYRKNGEMAAGIDPTAMFNYQVEKIGAVREIGARCTIGAAVILGDGVELGEEVHIGDHTVLDKRVIVTDEFSFDQGMVYFDEDASVDPVENGRRPHPFARRIQENIIVGPHVALPSEVQLGSDAIIPTQATIRQIGRFGTSKRMVTLYGSDEGPMASVACQSGIDLDTLRHRIVNSVDTDPKSAKDYKLHWREINSGANQVQRAYDRESQLVDELISKGRSAFRQVGYEFVY
ncbi:MAG TPA: hypothetical protein VLF39_00125 [Candidatus Saccharimonadales bacterium]|nr:hypothetical protein [Candidatus Saccharimonadales bacterium]